MTHALRGVLFDLDDTLFDHNHATECATAVLRGEDATFSVWSLAELRRRHSDVLESIHREVVAGRISIDDARRERFRRLLADAGADETGQSRAWDLAMRYRAAYQSNWRAVAGAVELLTVLRARDLSIAIVTNNLTAEQQQKMKGCALEAHVDALITSEAVGIAKPATGIYQAALDALGLQAEETVMVGDAWDTDIAGALAAGIRPIWFNWRRLPARDVKVAEISSLTPVDSALAALLA
ncbi:MAG TPA: HAD-IA family hydrolase [Vicinamibacterales bacterium]|nr:HAD-IA family hydrolase [Vicinamibacterales bacterium]